MAKALIVFGFQIVLFLFPFSLAQAKDFYVDPVNGLKITQKMGKFS